MLVRLWLCGCACAWCMYVCMYSTLYACCADYVVLFVLGCLCCAVLFALGWLCCACAVVLVRMCLYVFDIEYYYIVYQ